ncbi:hypothetical protein KXX16_000824 [Aspergillus fumigatus]|nr:hypothetical protein KXX38_000973 [Aspergillus fumigatus]KAH1396109.1 hypothetical protein KXX49_008253 [Aspergillus fumigatus]KAH1617369.1 hypothetical protein KXX31_000922 [Aspergillus fumigatus]KAH1646029.1 hypothetical protein KXX16_000824 [Aspergillus fumigatus]KAH2212460.1 hypothetical protein KXV58_009302 [Aspergillus fumigatus]
MLATLPDGPVARFEARDTTEQFKPWDRDLHTSQIIMDRYSPELQQRIRDLAKYPMNKHEVCEVWTEILKFHFPISQIGRPGNNEYAIQATPGTVFPFVQLSVATQLGTFEATRFLFLHCRSSPRQAQGPPSRRCEDRLRLQLAEGLAAIPVHDGLEIHGAIPFGPHIRFYRLMANGIFGCCLWGARDSLHVLHDHYFIAEHLEEIKSDWLSVYVPGY